MKKIFFLLCGLIVISSSNGQTDSLKKHYLKMYKQALTYNDATIAINALHGYIAEDNNILYKDTLSMLYFNTKSYYSALLLAEEVYKASPGNTNAMARTAECYDELGDPKTAAGLYEQVVLKTKSPYLFYKLAICQYQLKRNAECEASAKIALADTNSKRIGVIFTSADGSQQSVQVDAAATNLLGVLKMDAKNFAGAKLDFQQSLKLFPDFAGAKSNLDICDKNLKGGSKAPVKQAVKPKG